MRLAQASSAHLGRARHSFGRLWLVLAQLIESAMAQAQPGPVGLCQGEPEAWPGRQSLECLSQSKIYGGKKINKITVPILARLGLGQLRPSLA